MITKRVEVTFCVDVTVDETKFDDTFLQEYRETFYDFSDLDDHIEHIAWTECRGWLDGFVEGYGEIKDMGISADILWSESEIV